MKVGDKLICKTFPRKCNRGGYITRNEDMIIGKSYTILEIDDRIINKYGTTELRMLSVMGPCNYWSDYFYSEKECRKLKLKKLENVRT